MREGATPSAALDMTARNMEPSFYSSNRAFINRLMDYLHRAAAMNGEYFTNAILNPHWLPPPGFYTGEFDLPEGNDGFLWDDVTDSLFSPAAIGHHGKKEGADEGPLLSSRASSPFPSLSSINSGRTTRPKLSGESEYLNDPLLRPARDKNFPNNGIESLVDKMSRWKTYAQERHEWEERQPKPVPPPRQRWQRRKKGAHALDEGSDDSADDSSVLDLGGTGNPFAHLRPQGHLGPLY